MATPKFDKLCVEFIKRIPDQLKTAFTIGGGTLPDGYNLAATTVIDFINRALVELFNIKLQAVEGDVNKFIRIFPELSKISAEVELPKYTIITPHLDFFKILGGYTKTGNYYIKPRPEAEYSLFKAGKLRQYQPAAEDPIIIQIGAASKLDIEVFPSTITGRFEFHYIKRPVDPTTGNALTQNGSYDSPYYEIWHKEIIDIAHKLFLLETQITQ